LTARENQWVKSSRNRRGHNRGSAPNGWAKPPALLDPDQANSQLGPVGFWLSLTLVQIEFTCQILLRTYTAVYDRDLRLKNLARFRSFCAGSDERVAQEGKMPFCFQVIESSEDYCLLSGSGPSATTKPQGTDGCCSVPDNGVRGRTERSTSFLTAVFAFPFTVNRLSVELDLVRALLSLVHRVQLSLSGSG
jgi:hypothetical protein